MKVVVSASLSSGYDKRYVVVDEATGESGSPTATTALDAAVVVTGTPSTDHAAVRGPRGRREVLDDAQGYGYKSAQNAHRAYSYKSLPPKKKRQREAVKRQVERWCAGHEEFMQHIEQAMFYALKDGQSVTEEDVREIVAEHGLELAVPESKT